MYCDLTAADEITLVSLFLLKSCSWFYFAFVCIDDKIRTVFSREKQTDSHKMCSNVRQWHEHEHTNMLAIGQMRHQSESVLSRATHAVNGYKDF